MRLPRDLSGQELANLLRKLDYKITRQTGGHLRLTLPGPSEHHVTVPNHPQLRVGTLSGILADIASHLGISREKLYETLFK